LLFGHLFLKVDGACNSNYSGGRDQEDQGLRPAQGKSKTLYQTCPTQKMAVRVAQVVKWLSSKHELMSSNPNSAKTKRNKQTTKKQNLGFNLEYRAGQ
jgi:hypothetical protein